MGDTTDQNNQPPASTPQGDPNGPKPAVPSFAAPQPAPQAAAPTSKQQDQDHGDQPLGPAGKRALEAERAQVAELKQQLAELAPLRQLAAALGNGNPSQGKSEIELLNEKFAQYESDLAKERRGRLRETVARRHELPDDLAEVLKGDTEDELNAHAEVLKKYAPPKDSAATKRPKPDRSQGGAPGSGGISGKQQGLEQAAKRFGKKTPTA